MDFAAVPPKGSVRLSFVKRDSHFALFFASDCSQDESGRLIKWSSGNFPNEGCTSVDNPVATMIYYDNGTVTAGGPFGYNFALRAEFLSADGKCPPVSCDMPPSKCPEGLRILEESSGLPVACKAPRDKVPCCQGGAATSCIDGVILMVEDHKGDTAEERFHFCCMRGGECNHCDDCVSCQYFELFVSSSIS